MDLTVGPNTQPRRGAAGSNTRSLRGAELCCPLCSYDKSRKRFIPRAYASANLRCLGRRANARWADRPPIHTKIVITFLAPTLDPYGRPVVDHRKAFEAVTADPPYIANLSWSEAGEGHPEGTVREHIVEIESNLEALRSKLSDRDYWKLELLIHTQLARLRRTTLSLAPNSYRFYAIPAVNPCQR